MPTITDGADRAALIRMIDLGNDLSDLVNRYLDLPLGVVTSTMIAKAHEAAASAYLPQAYVAPPKSPAERVEAALAAGAGGTAGSGRTTVQQELIRPREADGAGPGYKGEIRTGMLFAFRPEPKSDAIEVRVVRAEVDGAGVWRLRLTDTRTEYIYEERVFRSRATLIDDGRALSDAGHGIGHVEADDSVPEGWYRGEIRRGWVYSMKTTARFTVSDIVERSGVVYVKARADRPIGNEMRYDGPVAAFRVDAELIEGGDAGYHV